MIFSVEGKKVSGRAFVEPVSSLGRTTVHAVKVSAKAKSKPSSRDLVPFLITALFPDLKHAMPRDHTFHEPGNTGYRTGRRHGFGCRCRYRARFRRSTPRSRVARTVGTIFGNVRVPWAKEKPRPVAGFMRRTPS